MTRKFLIILFWVASIFLASIYTHENPEIIETVKKYFAKEKLPILESSEGNIRRSPGNAFVIEFSEIIPLSEKTSFAYHDENISNFNVAYLRVPS